jgi:phospho-N-acetylmuramoyl-pentapeptide-transferase
VTGFATLVVVPFLIALAVVLIAGPRVIAFLASKKSVQPISPDAPEKHRLKHGTPTMGGVLILAGTVLATLGLVAFHTGNGQLLGWQLFRVPGVIAVFVAAGAIGFLDDLGKARKKENKAGLSERAKLLLQFGVAAGFAFYLYKTPLNSGNIPNAETSLFFGFGTLNLGPLYYLFVVLFIAWFANGANFTDGLDGLLSGTTLIISLTMAVCVGMLTTEIGLFYGALAGACAGFLFFNVYPAKAFMGDTGSLAIGMGLAAAALAAKQEILFVIVGAMYSIEMLSMMIQRYVFKYRRITKGLEYAQTHRVFRRAPIHHHFEELQWHETTVVGRFWVATLCAAAIGLLVAPFLVPSLSGGFLR